MDHQILEAPTLPPMPLPRPRYISLRLEQGVATSEVFLVDDIGVADQFTYELVIGCNDGDPERTLLSVPLECSLGVLTLSLNPLETDELIYTLLIAADSCADKIEASEDLFSCYALMCRIVAYSEYISPEVIAVGTLQACATQDGLSRTRWVPLPVALENLLGRTKPSHHVPGSSGDSGSVHLHRQTYYIFEPGHTEVRNFNPRGADGLGYYPKGTIVLMNGKYFIAGADIHPDGGSVPAPTLPSPPPPPPANDDPSAWSGTEQTATGVEATGNSVAEVSIDVDGSDDGDGDGDSAGEGGGE